MSTATAAHPGKTSEAVRAELMRLTKKGGGKLSASVVVEAARPAASILHHLFEWDNTHAAELYRHIQARHLIRVQVVWLPREETSVRVFASMASHRDQDHSEDDDGEDSGTDIGASYIPINTVMATPGLRTEFLAQCKADAKTFMAKYQHLSEVADVIAAMRKFTE